MASEKVRRAPTPDETAVVCTVNASTKRELSCSISQRAIGEYKCHRGSMNIAILGWGSLIWRPGGLRVRTRWRSDGPSLPIEFARISQDDRLTLVIQPGSPDQPTYWAFSEFTILKDARDDLKGREKSKSGDIHHALRDGSGANDAPPEIARRITEWVAQHMDVEAVMWTGMASNWREKRGRDFSPEDAMNFLLGLECERDRAKATYDRAREYVVNTPAVVDTTVRRAMRARGWADVSLPSILFEPALPPPKTESP